MSKRQPLSVECDHGAVFSRKEVCAVFSQEKLRRRTESTRQCLRRPTGVEAVMIEVADRNRSGNVYTAFEPKKVEAADRSRHSNVGAAFEPKEVEAAE